MKIKLNGKEYETSKNITILDLIKEKNISKDQVVILKNGDIVFKEDLEMNLIENDELEILRFVSGG
ncbi:thiamine biosynthesis protein ThiS [Hypnocyclicus thermotrophus]|uniref:Thiamine biosynthesis protein ThiS n=1 Tax=Hypnocyclicus thermotrophus TaxID=1627895 RepID=A0AA46DZV1_9FUSO|nr:sulfur carrier protein ThiS [Hypnocyclicus thermotrophus]TDT71974.1 thiamine biosynthesis protein ThiS [Hypnocyclicus thermotrophus]